MVFLGEKEASNRKENQPEHIERFLPKATGALSFQERRN